MESNVLMRVKRTMLEAFSWWWWGTSNNEDNLARMILILSVITIAISWYIWTLNISMKGKLRLPPGPRGLPLLGSLPFADPELHSYFQRLTSTYGPIFKLKMGAKLMVVLGSPETAKEVLKDNDSIFAYRAPIISSLIISYGQSNIVSSPYGPQWRMLRTVFAQEVVGKMKLGVICDLRRQDVRQTVMDVYSKVGTPINIREQMFLTMLNMLTSMLWGGTLKGEERKNIGREFKQVVEEIIKLLGILNISDFLPILARFDIQGIEHQTKRVALWLDRIFESTINKRIELDRGVGDGEHDQQETHDFLEVLLHLKDREDPKTPFTITHLKALFSDIVVAGTDTTSTTFEWAMTEMMNNPKIMKKVQDELEKVVGRNNFVEEADLPQLHYLNAVVKETLRLHPAVPLLIPRCPSESCIVGGYTIPKGAQVLVNAWAIQRDPEVWENPLKFEPERFLRGTSKWDFKGNDFRYIPFGSGRRICAGIGVVERMLPHVLASFVHLFEWHLPEGVDLDLLEKFGIVLKKNTPLIVIPVPRFSERKLYCDDLH
ncbi:hypothetical protein GIB67_005188 [Kingdonia uniflora]|uniref:Cytochrome P450 n=1 Tax=Kingdonia uniflora TaxID=39325 RepID=A0A7J7NN41_9MAGN|nr:hypothetical protein GIB67_005188 [Kingdonia uniflora]